MTQDAIDQAQSIQTAIIALMNEKNNAIAQVPRSLPSLTDEQRSEIISTISTLYGNLITAQQTAFTNLSGDYKNPS